MIEKLTMEIQGKSKIEREKAMGFSNEKKHGPNPIENTKIPL
jgi:hypothetical protein